MPTYIFLLLRFALLVGVIGFSWFYFKTIKRQKKRAFRIFDILNYFLILTLALCYIWPSVISHNMFMAMMSISPFTFLPRVISSLMYGYIPLREGDKITRTEKPRAFWSIIVLGSAIALMGLIYFYRSYVSLFAALKLLCGFTP